MYDYHKQVHADSSTNSKEKVLEKLKEAGLDGRLEGGERGFQMQGKREIVPDGWAIDRERAAAKGGEFGARDDQAERVRGGMKKARGGAEVE